MGKIEYDVYADGKKIGTASREQTTFEKALDDAARESSYREARLNSIASSAERLAKQYSRLSGSGTGGVDYARRERAAVLDIKEKVERNEKNFKRNIIIMLMYAAVGVSCLFFSGSETTGFIFIAAAIVRFIMAEVWQKISYPIIFFVCGYIAIRVFENSDVFSVWVVTAICLMILEFLCLLMQNTLIKRHLEKEFEKRKRLLEEAEKKAKKLEAEEKKNKKEPAFTKPYVISVDTKKIVEDLVDKGIF